MHQRPIASYHWLCSIDFHNVLDVSRTRVHVACQGPFPQLLEDVKRALVRLHYICKRTNGLLFVHSYCHADSTRQHVLQVISNTCEALLSETGENLFRFVCLTRSLTGFGGKSYVLKKLAQPVPNLLAEQSRDWRAAGVHVDNSPDICDSFGHLQLFCPIFVRSTWKRKNRRPNLHSLRARSLTTLSTPWSTRKIGLLGASLVCLTSRTSEAIHSPADFATRSRFDRHISAAACNVCRGLRLCHQRFSHPLQPFSAASGTSRLPNPLLCRRVLLRLAQPACRDKGVDQRRV